MEPNPKSVTLEASTDRKHADLRVTFTTHPDREHGGAARFDLEARDGTPVASFYIGCQDAALVMRQLGAIFPEDWELELQDVPVVYGD